MMLRTHKETSWRMRMMQMEDKVITAMVAINTKRDNDDDNNNKLDFVSPNQSDL